MTRTGRMPDGIIEEIELDLQVAKTLWVKAYRSGDKEQKKISKKVVKGLEKKLERAQRRANAETYMERRKFEKLMYLKAKT